jgi:hypothetical protein
MDWTNLLTSTVISGVVSGIIGVMIKGHLDRKLEKDKQSFEKDKMVELAKTQKDVEILKSEVGQLNALKQKNLEYYHSMQQVAQSKRIAAIESMWNEYLDLRRFASPIINFYSILVPTEYLNIIAEIDLKDAFYIKSLNDRELPNSLDTVPLLFNLETQRPFLGELLYYKFRSSMIILIRLRIMFSNMLKKKNLYLWNEDKLLIDHLLVVFSTDTLSLSWDNPSHINKGNPRELISTMGAVENELNKTIDSIISGEVSANLSLERVKKLNQGYQ